MGGAGQGWSPREFSVLPAPTPLKIWTHRGSGVDKDRRRSRGMVTEQDSPLTAQKTHPSSRCSPREGTHQDHDRGAGTGARAPGPVASCSPQGTWVPPQGRQAQSSRPPATRRRATEGRPPAGSPSHHHQLPRPFARVHEARGVLNSIGLSHEGPPVPFSSQRKGLASEPRGTRERRRWRGEAAGKHGKRRRGRECALEPEREGPRPRGRQCPRRGAGGAPCWARGGNAATNAQPGPSRKQVRVCLGRTDQRPGRPQLSPEVHEKEHR